MSKTVRRHLIIACGLVNAVLGTGVDARGQTSIDARIARVEEGLLPRAVSRGQASRRISIAERMAYHGIPGVSIVVIDDGRVGMGSRIWDARTGRSQPGQSWHAIPGCVAE
jgi:hypothetical protein